MQTGLAFPKQLTEKYQPEVVDDFAGLEVVKRVMQTFVAKPYPSAWYFWGPSGTGKTTMALAICKQINGELHHIPSRSCDLEKIEDVTRLCYRSAFNFFGENAGKACDWHVILVDEADQMTGAAQLALLSKLDATNMPPQTIFFFTANTDKLLEPRFLSRCRMLRFENPSDLPKHLAKIYKREGGRLPLPFELIAEQSGGNVRDAMGKLEVELMIGNDRKGLPKVIAEEKSVYLHDHMCGDCNTRIPHDDKDCRRGFNVSTCPVGGRPPCAGTTVEAAERARRGHETRRDKSKGKR